MNIVHGDLSTVQSGHIIHGCNCHGVMGAGVALSLRRKWPEIYNIYKHKYDTHGGLRLGTVIPVFIKPNLVVWNMMTQMSYSRSGEQLVSHEAIESCMQEMSKIVDKYVGMFYTVPRDLHFPKIGCGLGGGDWNKIAPILENYSKNFELTLWEYGNDN